MVAGVWGTHAFCKAHKATCVCVCICRGSGNEALFRVLVPTALATLPAEDQAGVVSAEMDANSWRRYVHSYPGDTTGGWTALPGVLGLLQVAFFTAAFSQSALASVVSHLAGEEPWGDLSDFVKVWR